MTWGIYGATGYTGRLIAAEAVRRGHRPVLLGRSEATLRPLALEHNLTFAVATSLGEALADLDAVVNAAGPFDQTMPPLIEACLGTHTSYLDISNELATVQFVLDQDARFAAAGISAVPAVGFGTVASETAAGRAVAAVRSAETVEVALLADNSGGGVGTAASTYAVLAEGGARISAGGLVRERLGSGIRSVRLPVGRRSLVAVALGDLAAVRATTGVSNVTASVAFGVPAFLLSLALRPVAEFVRSGRMKPSARKAAKPHEFRSYTWARATGADGRTATAWLTTGEGYAFTASSTVNAVEAVIAGITPGAHSSGQAFGADFALRVPGTRVELIGEGANGAASQP